MLGLSGEKRRKQGFTLSETMMVLALMAIVAAVAIPSIISYSGKMKQRELDDDARSIYMAAQHEIGTMETMGALEGSALQTGLVSVPDRYKNGTNPAEIAYYIYNKDTAAATPEGVLQGVVDSELTAHNYIVEYNPGTGDVLGVFYSDQVTFTKDDYIAQYNKVDSVYGKAAASGQANENGQLVGYYGAAPEKQELVPDALPVAAINIINKEKLVMEVNFDGGDIAGLYPVKISLSDGTHTAVLTADNAGINGGGAKTVFILDTLESAAPAAVSESLNGKTFEKSFREWAPDLTPGAQVTATVTVSDPKGIAQDTAATAVFNSLFADGSDETTAHIAYGRHLQNLNQAAATVKKVTVDQTVDFQASDSSAAYEHWQDVYGYDRQLTAIGAKPDRVEAKPGAQLRFLNVAGEGLFSGLENAALSGLTLVSPRISSSADAGSLAGQLIGDCRVENCAVYVEAASGDNWSVPADDPYHKYVVSGGQNAGGLAGSFSGGNSTVVNSYAAVKVSGNVAGGLAGAVESGTLTLQDSFSGGHTYGGSFQGTIDGGASYDLTDNIKGIAAAGGLVGKADGTALTLAGTVYSTCSVTGPGADTLVGLPGGAVNVTELSKVYSLGTAYPADGSRLRKSALTASLVNADGTSKVTSASDYRVASAVFDAKRYDPKVASAYPYPVVASVGMHRGDWPKSGILSGIFYWEQEGADYKIHALYTDENGKLTNRSTLCTNSSETASVEAYGYGVFGVGGTPETSFSVGGAALEAAAMMTEETDGGRKSAVAAALKGAGLLDDSAADVTLTLYCGGDTASGRGNVTASVEGKEYIFAPDFYKLQAMDESGLQQGTGDKWGVRTAAQLCHVDNAVYVSGQFEQSHNIAPGTIDPIGTHSGAVFTGSYDGGGYKIRDVTYRVSGSTPVGLFSVTSGAVLTNIKLVHDSTDESGYYSKDYFKDFLSETVPVPGAAKAASISAFAAPGGLGTPLVSLPSAANPISALSLPSTIANPDSALSVPLDIANPDSGIMVASVDGCYNVSVQSKEQDWKPNESQSLYEIFTPGSEEAKTFIKTFMEAAKANQTVQFTFNVGVGYNQICDLYIGVLDSSYYDLCIGNASSGSVGCSLSWWMNNNIGDIETAGVYIAGMFTESPYVNIQFPDTIAQGETSGSGVPVVTPPATNETDPTPTPEASHVHVFNGWPPNAYNDSEHWEECQVDGCHEPNPYFQKTPHDLWGSAVYDERGHKISCSACGYEGVYTPHSVEKVTDWSTKDEFKHGGTCNGCYQYFEEEHTWGEDNTCTVCGYVKPDSSVDPSACEHSYGDWQWADSNNHQRECTKCHQKEYLPHVQSDVVRYDDTRHWAVCAVCGGEYAHAPHILNELGQCDCGYVSSATPTTPPTPTPTPTPSAGTPSVMGGIVGQAVGTTITNCKVIGFTMGSSASGYSGSSGGSGGSEGSAGYEFKNGYEMSLIPDGNGNYILITENMQTPQSQAGGFLCEMDRLIKSAYQAVKGEPSNPEYRYCFRIKVKDGNTDDGNIGNIYIYTSEYPEKRAAINGKQEVRRTDDPGKVDYWYVTAQNIFDAYETLIRETKDSWPNQEGYELDVTKFSLQLENHGSSILDKGSINQGLDEGSVVPAAVLGGIAGTMQSNTVINSCETYISFGDGAIVGGIVGQALPDAGGNAAGEILDSKADVRGFGGTVTEATRLGGILADATGTSATVSRNFAAFVGLTVNGNEFPFVYAVGPGADNTNRYASFSGYATGTNDGTKSGIPEYPMGCEKEEFCNILPYNPEHDKRKPDEEDGAE